MKKSRKKQFIIALIFILTLSGFFVLYHRFQQTVYASNREVIQNENLPIVESNETINIYQIIEKNTNSATREEIVTEEVELEYTTSYQNNDQLGKGTIQVLQEGRSGLQKITMKNVYENGELVSSEQLDSKIIKSSIQKIVEIGTANYISNTKRKVGDEVYVSPSTVSVRIEPDTDAEKVITLNQNEKVKIIQMKEDWYQISYQNYIGWVEKDCVKSNKKEEGQEDTKTRQELLSKLSKNMKLTEPSGFTLNQFKKVLANEGQDKNKVFEKNAEYFYYAEKQYKINGVFIAAVGIHESAWGTSKIARDKKNLFGYGAYDSSAYASSYNFQSYAEGIDLISRVFTKYYLHPAGTKIYDGEVASGRYYSGDTLSAVNKRYASDAGWANGVYEWMSYLYHKL